MKMRKPIYAAGGAVALISSGVVDAQGGAAATRPGGEGDRPLNVVFILADDLGWTDLGCYGSTFHQTPRIDALAEQGLRFTQAYVASPLCAPARASIMTGLDPARTGMTYPDIGKQEVILEKGLVESAPANQPYLLAEAVTCLSPDYFTIGRAFKDAGYATGHIGKWHLGNAPYSPLEHGFDIDIPHTNAPGPLLNGWFYPFPIWPNHGQPGDHLEDLMAEEAARFIHENKDRPFFLNYWMFQPHSPWQDKEERIAKYESRADAENLQRNPVYAAMIESMDDAVGVVIDALEEAGVLDHTVIVFLSDNGPFTAAHPPPVMDARFAAIPVTSVLPLRGSKMTLYEGGIRIPQIIIWPGVTSAGAVTDELAHSNDFLPTFIDLLGLPVPSETRFDGVSLRPVLKGVGPARNEIFCHFPHRQETRPYENMTLPLNPAPAASLRVDDWKIIRFFADMEDGSDRHELFNLAEDIGELNNLAEKMPERTAALKARLDELLLDTEAVIPERNPAWRPPAARQEGWQVGSDAELNRQGRVWHIRSTGRDPWISTDRLPANARGPFVLKLRMNSNADGHGQVYFSSAPGGGYSERQSVRFDIRHNGRIQDIEVEIPVQRLSALRLDPATAPGEIALRSMILVDADGNETCLMSR